MAMEFRFCPTCKITVSVQRSQTTGVWYCHTCGHQWVGGATH